MNISNSKFDTCATEKVLFDRHISISFPLSKRRTGSSYPVENFRRKTRKLAKFTERKESPIAQDGTLPSIGRLQETAPFRALQNGSIVRRRNPAFRFYRSILQTVGSSDRSRVPNPRKCFSIWLEAVDGRKLPGLEERLNVILCADVNSAAGAVLSAAFSH